MPNNSIPALLTSAEVAARLKKTTRTVARLVARGEFPNAQKIGSGASAPFAIPESDVIAYEKKLASASKETKAS